MFSYSKFMFRFVCLFLSMFFTMNFLSSSAFAKGERTGLNFSAQAGSISWGSMKKVEDDLTDEVEDVGVTSPEFDFTPGGSFSRLALGYRFIKYLGVEYSTGSLGTLKVESAGTISGYDYTSDLETTYTYGIFDVILFIPLGRFDLFLKYGSASLAGKTETTTEIIGYSAETTEDSTFTSTGGRIGLGLQFFFNDNFGLRLDSETWNLGEDTATVPVTVTSYGLVISM